VRKARVKLGRLSTRSVLTKNSNSFNRVESNKCHNPLLVSDQVKLNNTKCCSLTKKEIPTQSNLNSNESNLYMDNQYNKMKLVIYHQNMWFT
jgi:hypothetical protein